MTAQTGKKETVVIKTKIYCNHCIQCGSCGKKLNKAVKADKGVNNIKINPSENTIVVTYDPVKTSPKKIRRTIAEAGFDADEIKATEAGFASLDKCCRP